MNKVIYDDGETKVEISGIFNEFLKSFKPRDFILEDDELDIVLTYVFNVLKENI